MQENHSFEYLGPCEQVDLILKGAFDFESYVLWRAKTHAGSCMTCQQRHPDAVTFLSAQIRRLETVLALEVEEIRGDHLREASAIGREAILSRPDTAMFALDDRLLYSPVYEEETGPERASALKLLTSLAKAGRRVKQVFATIHGEGLVWFNVVVNLNDYEQEYAWKECDGLVRQLAKESREFVFSAALAAELLYDLAWDPEPRTTSGVHLGVLYKVVQTAGHRYAETYLLENSEGLLIQPTESDPMQLTEPRPVPRERDESEDSQRIKDSFLDGQTAMMGSLTEIERALRELRDDYKKTDEAPKKACEATLRDALGAQFDHLAEKTRTFLMTAEYRLYPFTS